MISVRTAVIPYITLFYNNIFNNEFPIIIQHKGELNDFKHNPSLFSILQSYLQTKAHIDSQYAP